MRLSTWSEARDGADVDQSVVFLFGAARQGLGLAQRGIKAGLDVVKTPTERQPADLLAKPLPFNRLRAAQGRWSRTRPRTRRHSKFSVPARGASRT